MLNNIIDQVCERPMSKSTHLSGFDEDEDEGNDENYDGLARDPERLKAFNVSQKICPAPIYLLNSKTLVKGLFGRDKTQFSIRCVLMFCQPTSAACFSITSYLISWRRGSGPRWPRCQLLSISPQPLPD